MKRPLLLAFSLCLGSAQPSLAHSNLSELIQELSKEIKSAPTADLHYRRATEYRALGERTHTLEDLRSALHLAPGHRLATIALIKELGHSDEALTLAQELAKTAQPPAQAAETKFLLARIHHLRGKQEAALQICEEVQETHPEHDSNIDRLHAQILLDLKRPDEAATILKISWQRTKSIVIRNTWIDTALTAEQTDEVFPLIQNELTSSRYQSSWLIRRARAQLTLGKYDSARADLQAALAEISTRLNPSRPDLTLIADRGLIHSLLGNPTLAQRDLTTLQSSSLPPDSYRLLRDSIAGRVPKMP
ncbi:MAG: tetratricopeptide repeat protein [Roseibacillus sp.]